MDGIKGVLRIPVKMAVLQDVSCGHLMGIVSWHDGNVRPFVVVIVAFDLSCSSNGLSIVPIIFDDIIYRKIVTVVWIYIEEIRKVKGVVLRLEIADGEVKAVHIALNIWRIIP